MGGYDNHGALKSSLPGLLSGLDKAVGAFNNALKQLALKDSNFSYDKVTTFQASDFNRTWIPNRTDPASAGTDHAWGTHTFAFGGAVNGGNFYGSYPELGSGSSSDIASGARGRLKVMIPAGRSTLTYMPTTPVLPAERRLSWSQPCAVLLAA
jgi:uncharacterized protein (DUF1501 family)